MKETLSNQAENDQLMSARHYWPPQHWHDGHVNGVAMEQERSHTWTQEYRLHSQKLLWLLALLGVQPASMNSVPSPKMAVFLQESNQPLDDKLTTLEMAAIYFECNCHSGYDLPFLPVGP